MKLHKLVLTPVLVVAALAAPLARGDQVEVNASAVFPQAETFDVSFDWDTVALQIVPNTIMFNSSGPIGPFTLLSSGQGSPLPGFVWINPPSGDHFEILFGALGGTGKRFPELGAYPLVMIDFFCPTQGQLCLGSPARLLFGGTSLTVSAVAEPSSLFLLECGLVGLAAWGLRRKRFRASHGNPTHF